MGKYVTKKTMPNGDIVEYDEEGINFDDIPEITDFSNAIKNPFASQLKNGYTMIIERKNYDEVITVSKSRRKKNGDIIPPQNWDNERQL